jgi:hypothetical protein
MNLDYALDFVGGLSAPSKMPCRSYSIPAKHCKTGAKLVPVKNSVCSKCYALKGFYNMPNVRNALQKRFDSIDKPEWVEAMTIAIAGKEKSGFFRWHDSGDIQSVLHLRKICQIAINLPDITFWLPTREYSIVSSYVKLYGAIPSNLTIRLSSLMINGNAPSGIAKTLGLTTSGVSKDQTFNCPASNQDNKCLTCRACWNKSVENVSYKLHEMIVLLLVVLLLTIIIESNKSDPR